MIKLIFRIIFIHMVNLNSFDLNLLRVLDALLQTGSATQAGLRVGLSQPAVSSALKRLRAALDDPLFIRSGPRLEPTDHALSLAAPLRRILEDTQALLAPPVFAPETAADRFRLSGSDFFAELLMPALANDLSAAAPGMQVQLVDLVPDNHAAQLQGDKVDIALGPLFDGPGWMEQQYLFTADFVMIARRGHPVLGGLPQPSALDLDTFCALRHVLFSPEGKTQGMGDQALARIGRSRRVVATLPVMAGVGSTVAATDHVALIARPLALTLRDRLPLEIYPLPFETPKPRLGMIWHRRHSKAPAHQWLRRRIARLMTPLDGDRPGDSDLSNLAPMS